MPEVLFTILLPDDVKKVCYSPSTIVREYFSVGESLPVAEFVERSRKAYAEASERVRAKYGFSCSSAEAQLAELVLLSDHFPADATIRILKL